MMLYQTPAPTVKPTLWDENRLGWLGAAWFDGFGSRTLHNLSEITRGNGIQAYKTPADVLTRLKVKSTTINRFASFRSAIKLQNLAHQLDRSAIRFVLMSDPEYPALLREIANPPFALFIRGHNTYVPTIWIAVIGTRCMTPYGERVTSDICSHLVQLGFGVVSGLAFGIDATAHEATLEAGGTTLAVCAGGIDDEGIYPRQHFNLAQTIISTRGSLISEFPPGTRPLRHHFPLRNRILSGLCQATIVVQAAKRSGSLMTAHFALEQNRDVFAVPGEITNPQSRGCHMLLQQGATPYTEIDDLLNVLQPNRIQHSTQTSQDEAPPTLSPEEHEVWLALSESRHIDDIARRLHSTPADVSRRLMLLELKGVLRSCGGNIFERCSSS